MRSKLIVRKFHRYLGIFVGIQLLIWTTSGLFFTLIPIDEIRGNHKIKQQSSLPLAQFKLMSPSQLIKMHAEIAAIGVTDLQVKNRLDQPVYLVKLDKTIKVYQAENGEALPPLDRSQVLQIGENRSHQKILDAEFIEATEPGSEYRGGELPAWRLRQEDGTYLYVGAQSGQLRAVRTSDWRLYDFLWSLHIMDYENREDFNHWLLIVAAALGVITVCSGLLLFFTSMRPGFKFLKLRSGWSQ